MPRLKKAWSSWNFLGASSGAAAGDDAAVCVTYWLNKLQVGGGGGPRAWRVCLVAEWGGVHCRLQDCAWAHACVLLGW